MMTPTEKPKPRISAPRGEMRWSSGPVERVSSIGDSLSKRPMLTEKKTKASRDPNRSQNRRRWANSGGNLGGIIGVSLIVMFVTS